MHTKDPPGRGFLAILVVDAFLKLTIVRINWPFQPKSISLRFGFIGSHNEAT